VSVLPLLLLLLLLLLGRLLIAMWLFTACVRVMPCTVHCLYIQLVICWCPLQDTSMPATGPAALVCLQE
jgi:hypothetical protein